jgi:hypothetical protein
MQTNQTTRDLISKMLEDQKAKANAQKSIFESKQPKQEEPAPTFENIQVEGYTADEIEKVDLSEVLEEAPAPIVLSFDLPKATHTAPRIEVVSYTGLSFLLKGEDTYLIREELKGMGGIYRHKWGAHGPAWMFSNRRREEIETFLSEIL